MGLFTKDIRIASPLSGQCLPLKDVKDEAFSQEMLGKGVAVKPSEGLVTAPFDGEVCVFYESGHALCLKSDKGIEMLIHVGVDTVRMEGKGFEPQVSQGQKVKKGDILLRFDLQAIAQAGFDDTVPVIICNWNDFAGITCQEEGCVSAGDVLIRLKK